VTRIGTHFAFLLDLDGVLVDTEPLQFEAYRHALKIRGVRLDWRFEEYCQAAHFGSVVLRRVLAKEAPDLIEPDESWESIYADKNTRYLELLERQGAALNPGARDLLAILDRRQVTHAVVTHSTRQAIAMLRGQHPSLDAIEHWVTREDYGEAKPKPDGYLTALDVLDLKPHQAIGLEDSPRGLAALHAAGIPAVFVSRLDYPKLDVKRHGSPRQVETLKEVVVELTS